MPRANYIPFDLARALEEKGLRCDARDALVTYLDTHPTARDNRWLVERIQQLHGDGACSGELPDVEPLDDP